MMINKIVILAPANAVTGGPELAHQLCDELNNNTNFPASVYYYYGNEKTEIPNEYKKYNINQSFSIVDNENTLFIVPETVPNFLCLIKKGRRAIWWMSVDNYLRENDNWIQKIKKILHFRYYNFDKKQTYHFVQSEYAKQYLLNRGIEESDIYFLSDYLNKTFIANGIKNVNHKRENIILYNPKKGIEITKKIMEANSDIEFVPLVNLSREEMVEKMASSKIYIDFGNHPGKDRIPREAAINGCCVITGKRGAAKYFEDVSIADKYKFDDDNINFDELRNLFLDIFNNFEKHQGEFISYRNKIENEERVFKEEVANTFSKICGEK